MCTVFNLEADWLQLYYDAHDGADIVEHKFIKYAL